MKRLLAALFGLVCALGVAYGIYRYVSSPGAPEIEYKTAPVERKKLVAQVTASGTLSARVTVQVGSQVSGRLQEIMVDWNSPVKKGQLIARIDPQLFQAALEQANANFMSAKAQVTRAEVQLVEADRIYARSKALAAQSLAAQTEVDAAETAAKVAKTQIDVSKAAVAQTVAALNLAQVNLSYTKIVSPIDGIVISRNVDVGQTVAASLSAPVLFTIAEDLRKMQLDTFVAEGDVGRMEPGMRAQFTVDAYPGSKFSGEIAMIRFAPQTVQNVVTYDAVLAVDNSDLRLRPGMTANISIVYQERDDALVVPNAALRFKPAREPDAGASDASMPSPWASAYGPEGDGGEGRRRRHGDVGVAADGGDSGWHSGRGGRDGGSFASGGEGRSRVARKVYVLRNGEPESVDVRTGLSDGTNTEILAGELKEGDKVILDAVALGQKVTPTTVPGMGGSPGTGGGGGGGSRRSPF